MKKIKSIHFKTDLDAIGGELSSKELSEITGGGEAAVFGLIACCIGSSMPDEDLTPTPTPLPPTTSSPEFNPTVM